MSPTSTRPSTALADSVALHARARAWVDAFERGTDVPSSEAFDALACDVARFQAEHSPGYARLCHARGIDPSRLTQATAVPAVPTDAFKLTHVGVFPAEEATATFRTSGTTVGSRGTHSVRDASTYETASVAFGRRWLARDFDRRVPVVVLGPSPALQPDSSLGHMCAEFVKAFGEDAPPKATWLIDDGVLDVSAFDERVAVALAKDQPMLVLATSLALVHFMEAVGDDTTFVLPRGSRVMQTGGFKGKHREVPAAELRAELSRIFGLPERAIIAEYGMTELSSQFYEQTAFTDVPHGIYAEPPWARVEAVDPESLEVVPDGEVGLAKIIDLMNIDSAVVVLTQDRVRRQPNGFELLGRAPGAPARGCSIAIDELLGRNVS